MSPCIQIIIGVMATIAAFASAVAAWKAQSIASKSFDLQRKISKYQEDLFLLRTTISSLWQLKRVLGQPLAASDDEFNSVRSIHRQIQLNLEGLVQSRTIEVTHSSLFSDLSSAEMVRSQPNIDQEIDAEIKRLEAKINEIFS